MMDEKQLIEFRKNFSKENKVIYTKPYSDTGYYWIESVNGLTVASDKHLYVCQVCGYMLQSKNIDCGNAFEVSNKGCITEKQRNHKCLATDYIRVCDCEEIIHY